MVTKLIYVSRKIAQKGKSLILNHHRISIKMIVNQWFPSLGVHPLGKIV